VCVGLMFKYKCQSNGEMDIQWKERREVTGFILQRWTIWESKWL